jgi:hypothetical protein
MKSARHRDPAWQKTNRRASRRRLRNRMRRLTASLAGVSFLTALLLAGHALLRQHPFNQPAWQVVYVNAGFSALCLLTFSLLNLGRHHRR